MIKLIIPLILFAILLFTILLGIKANDQLVSVNLIFFEVSKVNVFSLIIWTFASGGILGLIVSYISILLQSLKIKQLNKKLTKKDQELSALINKAPA